MAQRKDFSLVYVEITMTPIRRVDESVEGFCVIVRDITQKKIIEKRMSEF
ncbi:PAS domain S-box protein [Acinetobacter baumannii]